MIHIKDHKTPDVFDLDAIQLSEDEIGLRYPVSTAGRNHINEIIYRNAFSDIISQRSGSAGPCFTPGELC